MVQGVKDPVLPLLWLGSLLWCRFNPWLWEFPHALGAAKKEGKKKKECLNLEHNLSFLPIISQSLQSGPQIL